MVLGELTALRKLRTKENTTASQKAFGKRVELSRLEVVQLFHVSLVKNRKAILREGLTPKGKTEGVITYKPVIFVSTVYEEAAFDYVGYQDVDVWTFYLSKFFLYPDEFSDYANHYYIEVSVPWYKLALAETR